MRSADLAIVGGGLSGGLLAWRLAETRPDLRVLLVEDGPVGGNHTWSFHAGDLTAAERDWIDPFVAHRWPGYAVRFPKRQRRIATGYRSVPSDRFGRLVTERLGAHLIAMRGEIEGPRRVVLADQSVIEAGAVIDARGPRQSLHLTLGYQKFLGLEVEFERPHGLSEPIVMDATVPQHDGYRFVYCLPFSDTRMLIEDTYYADGEGFARTELSQRIAAYAQGAGWGAFRIVREEDGILPIALGGDIEAHLAEQKGVPAIGLSAALFHPTTGYSLPDAVRTAQFVAALPDLSAPALAAALRTHVQDTWASRGYFRMLNRMLFRAGEPAERYRILEHFHRLPDPLIARFYAGRPTALDKARILIGKPPVPVGRALRVLAQG